MDILRKELEGFYASQCLGEDLLPENCFSDSCALAENLVKVSNGCAVVTDASSDRCMLFSGDFGVVMGYECNSPSSIAAASSDEDVIYERIHPEDLVDKRLLEYEFFKFVDVRDNSQKTSILAKCRIRMKDVSGQFRIVDNTTQVIRLSPKGKVWLILCTYCLATADSGIEGIDPALLNTSTGEIIPLSLGERRRNVLSQREKEVLSLIRDGRPSKQIAGILGISINTVNRHRQNILEKLSVGNSVEAVAAATLMRLL